MRFAARGVLCAICLVGPPAAAQVALGHGFSVTGAAGVLTDYVSRGVSQTRGRPAVQGTVELSHSSGPYVGAFAGNVAFEGENARQEVDVSGGFRFQLAGLSVDIGATGYTYPGYTPPPDGFELTYAEALLKLSYVLEPVTFNGIAAYMPSFAGPYGDGLYLEAGAEWRTPVFDIVLSGRVGYQWVERNDRFGTPDYLNYGVVVSRAIAQGFRIYGGWFGTNVDRSDCNDGQKICDQRLVAALAWKF